jgi:ABC-type multidrug transport system fused ATPase/permease subunit
MNLQFKNNFWGYFNFYYKVVKGKLFIYLGLGLMISFLDGLGLTMFIPLLKQVGGTETQSKQESVGGLHFLTDGIRKMGFELTMGTVLTFLVLLFAFKGLVRFFQQKYQVNVRLYFIKKIRYYLIDGLQELPYSGFTKLDAGNIQNTLTGEVQRLFQSMSAYLNAAQSVVMLSTSICLAFAANYQFALLVAGGSLLSNFFYKKIYVATKKASIDLSKSGSDFNSALVQSIYHFKYLKATNYFKKYSSKLKSIIDQTEELNKKIGINSAISSSVKEPIIIIIVSLVIYLQVQLMHSPFASILLSLLLFYRALNYLMMGQMNWQSFMQSMGGMYAVAEITKHMDEMKEVHGPDTYSSFNESIELQNLNFYYGERKILDNVNINIPKNHTIAFVGESGSGKTTLANIIAGLLWPQAGDVKIDGKSFSTYNKDNYRSTIGYISQEPVIFNDTIFNNITFWDEVTKENIDRFHDIIQLASLKGFIDDLENKEQTMLGDNGMLVSGGQKQRISIARELYKRADILILDEATSALDSETEKIIKDNIDKLHGMYTMIIIAHRLSTIRNADTIYLLDKGKIISNGTFEEMIRTSDKFQRMVSLQEV